MTLLVVAAFEPELIPVRALLRGAASRAVILATLGVSQVEAAASTARLLEHHRPARLVLVGSAGVYPGARPKLAVGDVVAVRSAVLADAAVVEGRAHLPAPVPRVAPLDASPLHGLVAVVAASPLAVTLDEELALRLAGATGAAVENLEVFAVARACAGAGVPATALLGVTNAVGPGGSDAWRREHERVAGRVAAKVLDLVAVS